MLLKVTPTAPCVKISSLVKTIVSVKWLLSPACPPAITTLSFTESIPFKNSSPFVCNPSTKAMSNFVSSSINFFAKYWPLWYPLVLCSTAATLSVVCSNWVKFKTTFPVETFPSMISPSVVLPIITALGSSWVNSDNRVDIKVLSIIAEKICMRREEESCIFSA